MKFIILLIVVGFLSCSNAQDLKPTLFAPNIISTEGRETGITFSKDGKHCLFTKWALDFSKAEIYESILVDGEWTSPKVVSFSGKFKDQHPQFSPDGKSVYFISQRPLDKNGGRKDYDIWQVNVTEDGWSQPINLGENINSPYAEYTPSITSDNTLYFTSEQGKIFTSKFRKGKFEKRQLIDNESINSEFQEWHAYVSPDENLLFFTSLNRTGGQGEEDLYISKRIDGKWTNAKPFKFNGFDHDYLATISADGKYLYFTSVRYPEGQAKFADKGQPQNGQPDIYKVLLKEVLN